MSFTTISAPPHFRPPSHIMANNKPTSTSPSLYGFQAPLEDLFMGDWYLIRTSNPFWKDKRNIRITYSSDGPSTFSDRAFYQPLNSSAVKSVDGRDTVVDDAVGVYMWQGKGLMRVQGAKWEILSFNKRMGGADWMMVFTQKNLFQPSTMQIYCRSRKGPSEIDLRYIEEWASQVLDPMFQQAMRGLFDVLQE